MFTSVEEIVFSWLFVCRQNIGRQVNVAAASGSAARVTPLWPEWSLIISHWCAMLPSRRIGVESKANRNCNHRVTQRVLTAVDAYAQWKTFWAVSGQREALRDDQHMQRHVGHLVRVPVADPQRKTAGDDVAVADRLDFVHAKLPDAFVERTRHKTEHRRNKY